MKSKYIIWISIIAIIGLMAFRLFSNKQKINEQSTPNDSEAIVIPVKTAIATSAPFNQQIIKTGNLVPFKESKVVLPSGGMVEQVSFELGDYVKKGQVLALMDSRINQLELEKIMITINKLKYDLNVYQELQEGKAATQEKVTQVKHDYDEAINQAKQLEKQISDAAIRAPFSGIITEKLLEGGVFANAGTELGSIINLSSVKVQISLTESEAYEVVLGQEVKITTHVYPDQLFSGKLTYISPQADQAHNYMAEITLTNSENQVLRSGTFVYVDFSRETKENLLTIPRSALVENLQSTAVYLVQSGRASIQEIKTGKEFQGNIEVLEGLKAGDEVVISGQINLKNNAKIRVAN